MSATAFRSRPAKHVQAGDRELIVSVRESDRAQAMRIIVGPRRPIEVIVPSGTPDTAVETFLASKCDWIARKVAAAEEIVRRPRMLGLEGKVWLQGEPLRTEHVAGKAPRAELRDGVLRVTGKHSEAADAIERWYRREARRRISSVAEREAARLGLRFNSLAIRDQKTRWGSCSRRGNLSFSWRLLLCPSEVLDYVAVHELLHLRKPNHSKAFWQMLESAHPGWQDQARWLREHGQELHEYALDSAALAGDPVERWDRSARAINLRSPATPESNPCPQSGSRPAPR
jgi:predicted metal-dependent hydrolase